MPDFRALTGDSADGFPGLPGFGATSASVLIGAYEHLEQIPPYAHQWKVNPRGALRLATTLNERRDEALFYRKLATLIDTIALADSLEGAAISRRAPRAFRAMV